MREHELAERTSRALHTAVGARLREDPQLVARAAARVAGWGDSVHPYYRDAWAQALTLPIDALCALLEDDGEVARDLRQASPFAGVLDSATRWRIWREARAT